jgi:hypothetical protein
MKILITGCARSGTSYAWEILTRLGMEMRREVCGTDKHGAVDWMSAFLTRRYTRTYHQVREPLRVIESCHTISKASWDIILHYESRIGEDDSLLLKAMKFWLYWNGHLEEVAYKTYRVEDFLSVVPEIVEPFGIEVGHGRLGQASVVVPVSANTRRTVSAYRSKIPRLTWKSLKAADPGLTEAIQEMAKRYGYDVSEKS